MKVIISGGGTGGHVFPAIAIANAIRAIEPDVDILFVGAKGKLEMEKVPKAGYPIEGLNISGFHRKLTMRNLMFPFKLISSLWKARGIVKRFQPDVAVGVGGYASGPTLDRASRAGVPTLIQEQNSYAGVTNKLLAKRVQKACVAYDNMERFFPAERIQYTGNPVRSDILDLENKRAEGYAHFGLEAGKKTIFAFGGSLGAKTINEAFANSTELLKKEDVQVLWQMGKLYEANYREGATAQLPNVEARTFIDRMDLAYALSDIIIGRAGALTISELCIVGKPALLVPSPNVSEDHQTKNAMALVDKKAALLVKDKVAKTDLLPMALDLLKDEAKQGKLSQNIKELAKPNAAAEIAKAVIELAK